MVATGEQHDEQQQDDGEGDDPRYLDPAWGAGSRSTVSALAARSGEEGGSAIDVSSVAGEARTQSTVIETLCLCQVNVSLYGRRV
jgi:hypothetical protein